MKRTLVLSALAVASTLALAACGKATESGNTYATTSATSTATTTAETTETTMAAGMVRGCRVSMTCVSSKSLTGLPGGGVMLSENVPQCGQVNSWIG